jgi:hypothetical protein
MSTRDVPSGRAAESGKYLAAAAEEVKLRLGGAA